MDHRGDRLPGRSLFLCVWTLLAGTAVWADDPQQDLSSLTLEQLMNITVDAAALHPQTLRDAPASVTVITAEDIYKYGYRTLGEAMASVRGFSLSYNRTYTTVGVRGFNLPWDYGSRILVMVNGHDMADHVFDSMLWFGDDFPIDMHLVQRIEIIRGPSSALYGSNGEFAAINVVTKSPEEAGPPSLTTQFGSFGKKKAQMMATVPIGKRAKVLLSGTVFNNTGESPLYFAGLDTPETNHGQAIDMDAEKGYHFFSNLTWRNWNITASLSNRNKIQPVSWGDTVFNDRGTHVDETANYVDAVYTRELARGTFRWRTYYNQDHLRGRFEYPRSFEGVPGLGIEGNRSRSDSDWIGTQLTYRFEVARLGTLTAGAEAQIDLRTLQSSQDFPPDPREFVSIDRGDKMYAAFLQVERKLASRWTLNLGLRADGSAYRRNFASPRAALIYQPSSDWTYKFLYGRAFRNPSAFDLFYEDGRTAAANPNARPEKVDTIEVDVERRLGKHMNLVTSAYAYQMRDFLVNVYNDRGIGQTQNAGKVHAKGLAMELQARPASWLEATASYSIQESDDDVAMLELPNSPRHLAKVHFAVPLGRKFDLSSGMQYISSRATLAGASVQSAYLADFTVTSKRLLPNFDIRAGVKNAFNRSYSDPVALNPRVDSMQQPGRAFFVELIVRGGQ
jgi:outer membrane receptor for ferrienterochelin and colicins